MHKMPILALALNAGLLGLACSSSDQGGGGSGGASGGSLPEGGSAGAVTTGGAGGIAGSSQGGAISGGSSSLGGSLPTSGGSGQGGETSSGGRTADGGTSNGGALPEGGSQSSGGASTSGGTSSGGASNGGAGEGGASQGGETAQGGSDSCSGPIGTFSGAIADGIVFMDTDGNRVNAHGGGIIKVEDTYYLHGEYFDSTSTDNNFRGFTMYSSQDLSTWKYEGVILPQQPSGELGPARKGERPHIIRCPSTGEFVLYAHAASEDYQTDKEIVYATSDVVNDEYTYQGPLTNSSGQIAAHSDMSAVVDGDTAYVVTESGHVYTLSSDCHSWLSDQSYSQINGDSGGSESPTLFKADNTWYWIGSYKTGWRANNNFYSTAPAVTGPWTYQGHIAPVTDTSTTGGDPNPPEWISDERTWLSQSTWVTPVQGCSGTVYVFWGDHWDGTEDTTAPGRHNYLASYVFQPLVFDGTSISMSTYHENWMLDVGDGTWSAQ